LSESIFLLAADIVLLLHALFVAFVICGQILVLVGCARGWSWIRNPWFRISHLAAIAVVVAQSWAGASCPLTVLEMTLRARAGASIYAGDFIAHWLHRALYYDLPPLVFVVSYTLFGALVAASWWRVPPRAFPARQSRRRKLG
jgi:hypothetical protein